VDLFCFGIKRSTKLHEPTLIRGSENDQMRNDQ
jgi:hypothetical protein